HMLGYDDLQRCLDFVTDNSARALCLGDNYGLAEGRPGVGILENRRRETTMSDKKWIKAEDVARLAGVSRSAVSRTFTPGASVSEKTRQKVLSAAEALG
ncbi:LacI family DNA-binding transcriptional regulator, partial [Mycobacterium tuberculosis]|nr:LacI family DNA-binding transcriptional regulator [Mycobacterium tuberculosis]